MKFFNCCSSEATQTIEPEIVSVQTDHSYQQPLPSPIVDKTDAVSSTVEIVDHEHAEGQRKNEEVKEKISTAEVKEEFPPKTEPVSELKSLVEPDEPSDEESSANVEEIPEDDPPKVAKVAVPPITLSQSAGIMDLNKLFDNNKCMVLLGHGSWTCETVSNFMNENYNQYPEIQMIKYLGQDVSQKFLIGGPIAKELGPLKNAQGMFSIPVVCFMEQMNVVNIFAGLKMEEYKNALDTLSSMPLSVPPSKEEVLKAANEAGLAEHNRVRDLHINTPAMVQGLKQTTDAQAYAEKLARDWDGKSIMTVLHHAPNKDRPGQGENLAANWESSPAAACKMATNQWYDEIKDYNYARPGFAMNTGHFTQAVWTDATILGLGVSQLSSGAYVVVGRYSGKPGTVLGNMAGRFPEFVLPLKK